MRSFREAEPMKTRLLVTLLLSLVLVVPAAVSAARDELVVVQGTEVTSLDPQQTQGIDGIAIAGHIFNRLLTLDTRGEIVPDLAERWEVAGDQKTWTFHLRRGVKFHDGSPFNAEAVRFTIERAIGPKSPPSLGKRYLSVIERVEVVDDATVRIVTRGPSGPFLYNLAHISGAGIMSPAATQKAGANIARQPVGTGPFRLVEWRRGDELVLERNDAYFGEKPRVRRIVYRVVPEVATRVLQLETGEADVALRIPPFEVKRLGRNPKLEIQKTVSIRAMVFYLNTRKKPFDDVRVRRAVNLAIDRKELIQSVLSGEGTPLDSPIAPTLPGHVRVQTLEYNPAAARDLLRQAGVAEGTTLIMDCPHGRFVLDREVCTAVAGQLGKVGLKVQTRIIGDYPQYIAARAKRDYDLTMLGFAPGSMEADGTFHSTLHSSNAGKNFNWADYSNPRVDALVEAGRTTIDEKRRRAAYAELQKIVMQDMPMLMLYAEHEFTGIRKGVTGVFMRPDQALLLLRAAPAP
jgi:peptide/nickel transport system substrate-binding protein